MDNETEINVFKALDFIRDNSIAYARAKAERIWIEEFRKSKKALLMRDAENRGFTSSVAQEREAYAHPDYISFLDGLKEAVEKEEGLRWLIISAQARVEVWRSIGANQRAVDKNT